MFNIESLLEEKNLYKPISDEIVENMKRHSSIIFWGSGITGQDALEYLASKEVRPNYFVDKQERLHGKFIQDILIISIDELKEKIKEDIFVLITSNSYFSEISKELEKMGLSRNNYACANICPKPIRDGAKEHLSSNLKKYEQVYELLEDDLSRETYYSLLKYRLTLDNSILEKIFTPNQYFGHEFFNEPIENFVDCGAFDGDTLDEFLKFNHFNYKNIYCFEPDFYNFAKLNEYIANKQLNHVKTYSIGTWNTEETLKFNTAGPAGGSISLDGEILIEVNKLDNVLADKPVDFIKMDIEGAELNALYGAEKIIKNNRPILAICVYHKLEDFYDIPLYIHNLDLNYAFYFRHHSMSNGETVCYAIPQ